MEVLLPVCVLILRFEELLDLMDMLVDLHLYDHS
jgi:hypothetical protein